MEAQDPHKDQGVDQGVVDGRLAEASAAGGQGDQVLQIDLVDGLFLEGEPDTPLVGQRGIGYRPTLVEAADELVLGDEHLVEEHLVEFRLTGDLTQGSDVDARSVHGDRHA